MTWTTAEGEVVVADVAGGDAAQGVEGLDVSFEEGTDDWLTLQWEPVGRFSFHRVEGHVSPQWPGETGQQQVHFDLLVDDLQAASATVERAGGTPLTEVMDPGPKAWRIFADPAGHPFCLVSVPE